MDIQKEINSLKSVIETIEKEKPMVEEIIRLVIKTLRNGNTIFTCGNGGSAADAEHLAAELVGRYQKERISLPAISLSAGTSLLTCLGNDYGFDNLFSRQISGLGKPNDLLICFSTSGNSPNIIEAIHAAKKKKIITVALLGKEGGKTKGSADYQIIVSSQQTARIQEMHTLILHLIAEAVDEEFS